MGDALSELLRELEHFGREQDAQASHREEKMLNITPETGELLALLVQALRARRILEIGTSNGYSTLWLAEAAREVGGRVVTVEVSPDTAAMARHNLQRAGLDPWVRQEVTDAGAFLDQLAPASFELLFLDAYRGHYAAWWPRIREVLAPGGYCSSIMRCRTPRNWRSSAPCSARRRAGARWWCPWAMGS